MSELKDLIDLFNNRRAVVGVIGLGYVGLPLAATIAEAGFAAVGFDTKTSKIEALRRRESYIRHVPAARLETLVRTDAPAAGRAGLLSPARTSPIWRSCDAILICVPTPLTENREPDLSYVVAHRGDRSRSTCAAASSSCWRARPIPARPTKLCGRSSSAAACASARDFHLAFSPEREDPNNPQVHHAHDSRSWSAASRRSAAALPRRSTAP